MSAFNTVRSLAKQPVFSLTVIATLALGIGANTAIFSVFEAVLLRPLPYRDPGHLAFIWQQRPDGRQNGVSAINYLEWIKQSKSFEQITGLVPRIYNVSGRDDSVQVMGAEISAGMFSMLGVRPVLGREFAAGEVLFQARRLAVISYGLWQRQFGGDAGILGQPLRLNGQPYTLIGVLPRDFVPPFSEVEVWTPLALEPGVRLKANNMAALGRLKHPFSIAEADREMRVVAKNLEAQFPDVNRGWSAMVVPLLDAVVGSVRPAILALLVGVALVLLIVCVNVANLLLARSETRQKEVAIRSALGAGRAQLVQQILAETVALAFAGGLLGVGLAYGGLQLLVGLSAGLVPRIQGAGLNATVLGFAIAVTLLTGVLFGLHPARQLLQTDVNLALRESGRGAIDTRSGVRSRNALVISEIALSLMLAIGAGLMMRSLLWLQNESRGFPTGHLLSFRVSLSSADLAAAGGTSAYYRRLLERIQAIPGVRAVAATTNLPLDGYYQVGQYFQVLDAAPVAPTARPSAPLAMVNPGYFRAAGIPLLKGREFDARDQDNSTPVVIISRSLERRYFAGENPIGRKLSIGSSDQPGQAKAWEVVGVAGDIRYLTRRPDDSVEMYVPYGQRTWPVVYVMARADRDPMLLASSIRAALNHDGWRQPISDVRTIEDRIGTLNGKTRLNSMLATLFAAIALSLAGVGIYGVISYSTARSTREIGVRMALGATRSDIMLWIVRRAVLLTAAGVAAGLAGHFAMARVLGQVLFGTSPLDAATLFGAAALLALIALLASYIPARRAVRTDPAVALRSE